MNHENAAYCRECGAELKAAILQTAANIAASGSVYQHDETMPSRDENGFDIFETGTVENDDKTYEYEVCADSIPDPPSPFDESLLTKLDRMEKELEIKQNEEYVPELVTDEPDALDEHEEALKNIAYTLDSLISDLLEAEIREYAFPDFIHPDETGFPMKAPPPPRRPKKEIPKKGRNIQEILVILALVAAIFLVGLSFGLWGSYFFGL
jgi:hypothetical protein